MPHELDRRADGSAAMFSVHATPWHREGTILNEAPSLADALTLGGLDFEVAVRPLYIRTPATPALPDVLTYERAADAFATVRTDRETVLGVVSGRYQPLQNRDAFGVLVPLLDAGLASLETGGALRDGRDAWMLVRFNIDSPVVQEVFADEVIPFGMISNNHSGQRKVVERVLNDQTGHRSSDTRREVYQEKQREEVRAKSAATRRRVRSAAFGRPLRPTRPGDCGVPVEDFEVGSEDDPEEHAKGSKTGAT